MLPGVGVHAHNHAEKREEKFNAHGVVLGAQRIPNELLLHHGFAITRSASNP